MIDHATLQAAAFKAELADSRRLAARTGMPPGQALHDILTLRAGAAGLEQLLAERLALRQNAEQRAAVREAAAATARARRAAAHSAPWQAWFDGSARPNPGRCAIGGLLEGPDGRRVELAFDAGYGNSSEAEYRALIAVLEAALANGARELAVHGDSQVVIDDMNGPACAAAPALKAYRDRAQALLAQLPQASLRWIPRHKNTRADALSQRAVPLAALELTA
jgi:ribonuclease HI